MTVRTFHDALHRRPFVPFRLVMSSGREYEVRHPENADLSRTAMYIAVQVRDEDPPSFLVVSLLHVSAIEPLRTGEGFPGPQPPPPPEDEESTVA